jgi:hypothetical protein
MSACAIKQWGRGTPCVKESNTAAAKEMAAKLAQMQAERDRQDANWHTPTQSNILQESYPQKEKKEVKNGGVGPNGPS